jgi:hypothetical protein
LGGGPKRQVMGGGGRGAQHDLGVLGIMSTHGTCSMGVWGGGQSGL